MATLIGRIKPKTWVGSDDPTAPNGVPYGSNTLSGDWYYDTSSRQMWAYFDDTSGAASWHLMSVGGGTGSGRDGEQWFTGSGDPNTDPALTVGSIDHDWYLDKVTGDYYELIGPSWTIHGNLKGDPGYNGATGSEGPVGPPGAQATGSAPSTVITALPAPVKGELWIITHVDASTPKRPDGSHGKIGDALVHHTQPTPGWTNIGPFTGAPGPIGAAGPVGVTGATGSAGSGASIKGLGTWPSIQGVLVPASGDMWILSGPDPTAPAAPGAATAQPGDGFVYHILPTPGWTNVGPIRGPSGIAGVAGSIGSTGVPGPIGLTGPSGLVGPAGPTGSTGADGSVGAVGLPGIIGPSGSTGAYGPTGIAGPTGVAGSIGPSGSDGSAGPPGPGGSAGPTGATGAVGPTGVGSHGPAGSAGTSTDFKGHVANQAALPAGGSKVGDIYLTDDLHQFFRWNGTNWTRVSDSIQGATGPSGPAGKDGSGVSLKGTSSWATINGIASPAPGDMWLLKAPTTGAPASPSGAPAQAGQGIVYHNLPIPGWVNVGSIQGPAGTSGVIGPQGSVGVQGPIGPTGATGVGSTGPAGVGTPGPVGPTGVGPPGGLGPAGPRGTTGATGVGAPGVAGASGPAGSKGATGTSISFGGTVATPSNLPTAATNRVDGQIAYVSSEHSLYGYYGGAWHKLTNSLQGVNGPAGLVGSVGPAGARGPVGPKGNTGHSVKVTVAHAAPAAASAGDIWIRS